MAIKFLTGMLHLSANEQALGLSNEINKMPSLKTLLFELNHLLVKRTQAILNEILSTVFNQKTCWYFSQVKSNKISLLPLNGTVSCIFTPK